MIAPAPEHAAGRAPAAPLPPPTPATLRPATAAALHRSTSCIRRRGGKPPARNSQGCREQVSRHQARTRRSTAASAIVALSWPRASKIEVAADAQGTIAAAPASDHHVRLPSAASPGSVRPGHRLRPTPKARNPNPPGHQPASHDAGIGSPENRLVQDEDLAGQQAITEAGGRVQGCRAPGKTPGSNASVRPISDTPMIIQRQTAQPLQTKKVSIQRNRTSTPLCLRLPTHRTGGG